MPGFYMFLSFLLLWMVWLVSMAPSTATGAVSVNDNTRPAGRLEENALNLRLYAGVGSWRPEGPQGAPVEIAAFGEEGADLSIPGPLIRVREGTTIALTLRNALGSALRVTGLCARPSTCEPVSIAAGATQEIRFTLNAPGTYFYWGATGPGPVNTPAASRHAAWRRDRRRSARGIAGRQGVRDLDLRRASRSHLRPGRRSLTSSPSTARRGLTPRSFITKSAIGCVGGIINLSRGPHAMHLHGFYFTVEATGDIGVERRLAPGQQRTAVTEYIGAGRTFVMSWTPERPGNWLFHCHMTDAHECGRRQRPRRPRGRR